MTPARDDQFVEFVTAQRAALLRMARVLTAGDDQLAEDLVQTALTKLFLSWPRVHRGGNVVAYARTILTHAFVDESRRAHRRRERIIAAPIDQPDRRVRAEERPLVHTVQDALAVLPRHQRAVVVLRHWLDLDVAETARILGCSRGTVKSQNARALAQLRSLLGPHLTVS